VRGERWEKCLCEWEARKWDARK